MAIPFHTLIANGCALRLVTRDSRVHDKGFGDGYMLRMSNRQEKNEYIMYNWTKYKSKTLQIYRALSQRTGDLVGVDTNLETS